MMPFTPMSTPEDPLKSAYLAHVIDQKRQLELLAQHNVALLCIDMQYLDAADGHGIFANPEMSGVSSAGRRYYFSSLKEWVLPNVRALQDAFRDADLEVIHVRIQSLTMDGRDRSAGHRRLNILAAPGSKEAEFLPEIAPQGDEIIINKTASGVFSSTNLNYILKNMGIQSLFVTGVYTNECVDTTIRDACDLGYFVTMIEDACTTVTPELHEASVKTLRDRYARVVEADQALAEIRQRVTGPHAIDESESAA
ncbi:MAG: N-carbamoylsarcosine amidase [Verrucomicrobiales bacterium]|nr:N-carbamoylsarcosine amidase [Verrucomicrobiales bacterium]